LKVIPNFSKYTNCFKVSCAIPMISIYIIANISELISCCGYHPFCITLFDRRRVLLNFISQSFDGWLKEASWKQRKSILKAWWLSICIRIGGRNVPQWMWMRHH